MPRETATVLNINAFMSVVAWGVAGFPFHPSPAGLDLVPGLRSFRGVDQPAAMRAGMRPWSMLHFVDELWREMEVATAARVVEYGGDRRAAR